MSHVGILVGDLEPAMRFYRDILGFTGNLARQPDSKQLDWVNMKVPDRDDYIEFMLYRAKLPPGHPGHASHLPRRCPT